MKNIGILLPKQGIHWILFACDITVAHLTIRNCNILGVAYATECPSMPFVFYKGLPVSGGHSLHYANTFSTSIESESIHETDLWAMERDRNVVLKF